MARKIPAKGSATVHQLAKETDELAKQADKTKRQMDKVQRVADSVVHKVAIAHKGKRVGRKSR
jgi:hypothetical protein